MPKWMGCRLNQSNLKTPSITSIRVVFEDLFAFFFKWVCVCVFSRRCHTSFKSICFGSGLIVQLVDISCPCSMTWPYICDHQLPELLSSMWGLLAYSELSTTRLCWATWRLERMLNCCSQTFIRWVKHSNMSYQCGN